MGQDNPPLDRLGAILADIEVIASTSTGASADDLPKLRADASTAAQILKKNYGDKALERAKLLEARPEATFFARMVTKEVERLIAEPLKR